MIGFEAAAICLSLNMYHEARSEGVEGMMAVAEVTINRVLHDDFPNDVCSVVQQTNRNPDGSIKINQCQFSWYCDGKSDKMRDKYYRNLSYVIAVDYLTGFRSNLTDGAIYYHADYVNPYWARHFTKTTKIGTHIFYKE